MNLRRVLLVEALFVSIVVLMSYVHTISGVHAAPQEVERRSLPPHCPAPGTEVALAKVMSDAFVDDYRDCDVVVEATFLKVGHEGYSLGRYDSRANATFQIVEPGGTPRTFLGRSFGRFAGIPKAQSDVLFTLKEGETIVVRGAPIRGRTTGTIFQAESVVRKTP